MEIPYVFLPREMFAEILQSLLIPPEIFAQPVGTCETALPLMRLPPEIFAQIISYLPDNTLKSLRLTCKAFEPWATPRLFEELVITSGYADLEIADRIIDRFASVIRNIRVCSQPFHDYVTKNDYAQYEMPSDLHKNGHKLFIHCKPHCEQFWKVWTRLKAEDSELEMTLRPLDTLCRALKSSMQIFRVTLTDMYRSRTPISAEQCWCVKAATEAQKRMLDPWTPLAEQESWPLKQNVHNATPKTLNLAWLRLMQALKMTRRTIQEIVVFPTRLRGGLMTDVFADRLGYAQITSRALGSLTRFKLVLDVEEDPMLSGIELEKGKIANVLSIAVNLVHLDIECQQYRMKAVESVLPLRTRFHAVLEGFSLPRLQILKLEGLSANTEQLLHFLRSHQCLRDVALHHCGIEHGKWELIVQGIRDTTCVRVLRLDFKDFVAAPGGNRYTSTGCTIYQHSKMLAREDGSYLTLYGRYG